MTYRVCIKRHLVESINELPEKTRRIIHDALMTLEENPYPGIGGDKEKLQLKEGIAVYRLHIGRSYTAFYTIDSGANLVRIHDIMTIGQAHKKYGRI